MAQASDFRPGDKVFIDSFAGLVPAVVVDTKTRGADWSGINRDEVVVRLTATRGAYKKGEVLSESPRSVVKRAWVHTRTGTYVIREPRRSNPSSSSTNMLVGGGAGAVLGAVVGGPVGAAAGAVGGALVGAAASGRGRMTNPKTFSNPWGGR